MTIPARVAAALGAAMSAAALTITPAIPAQAATTGWRVVFTHHYGVQNNASGYLTVIAPGTRNAWAFGSTDLSGATPGVPVAEHWNGSSWRGSTLPAGMSSAIVAASAPAGKDIWAVTQFGGDILHWNGSIWKVAHRLSGSGQLTGVTAFSTTNVWVFGGGGFTGGLGNWHYNGSSWQQVTGTASGISRASALSPGNIWAIGATSSPETAIVHYNGTGWQRVKATALTGLQFSDILARSKTSIWATASSQANSFTAYLVHYNGSSWSKTKLPWAVDPERLARDGHSGFWLSASDSGSRSWMVHRSSAGRWSRTLIGSAPTGLLDPVLIPGTASLWGAGLVKAATGTNAAIWVHGQVP